MTLTTRLLGSAAGLCAAASAQAADLPVQKAAPVEYVRVCTEAGEGFFYIPGTDTCLRIGGRVRAERIAIETFDRRDDGVGFLASGRLNVDARTQTEYGTLRAFLRYELIRSTGAYLDSGSALNGVGRPGQFRTGTSLGRAFVQFGPLTAGRVQSFFDFYAHDPLFSAQLGSDRATQALAYTATFGDVYASVAIEDGIERRVFSRPTNFGVSRIVRGEPRTILFPDLATPSGTFFPEPFVAGGQTAPDVVGALGISQSWGSAQLSGAVHQVRSANSTQNIRGGDNVRPGIPDAEYGFAVQGGVQINLPFIAAGDVLWLQAAYADGAINYLGFGSDTSVRNRGPFILNQSDAFVNAFGDT